MNTESKAQRLARISRIFARDNKSGSALVAEVLKAIDAERISSAVSILGAHAAKSEAIRADRELSDEGKKARIKSSADSHLGNVGVVAKKIAALEAQHKSATSKSVPLPRPTDPWEIQCDFEIARHIKDKGLTPYQLTSVGAGEIDARIREAIARVPAALSGLSPEKQALIRGSLIDPTMAVQFSEEEAALRAAREVIQAALYELAPEAEWSAREWVEHVGPAWNLPGVAQSQADRMATGGPEHLWDALSPGDAA
jgi:hypothetical protein